MNKLSADRRATIINALCEGKGIHATARLTGSNKDTVMKLMVGAGEFASTYQDIAHRSLPTTRVEADEIWAFVGAKQRRATRSGDGDIGTFTAIDADTRLIMSWLVGPRNQENATAFRQDIRSRVMQRIQLTTDGHNMYEVAVRAAFRWDEVHWAIRKRRRTTRTR